MTAAARRIVEEVFARADAAAPPPAPPPPRPAPISPAEAQARDDAVLRDAKITLGAAAGTDPAARATAMVAAARRAGAAGHEALLAALAEGVMDVIGRLAVLEAKRTMSFSGAHDPGRAYAPGEAVQRGGSLWVAMAPTRVGDIPGAHTCWREIGRCK